MFVFFAHSIILIGSISLLSSHVCRYFSYYTLIVLLLVIAITSGGGSDAVRYFEIGPSNVELFLDHSSVFPLFKSLMRFGVEEPYGVAWRSWYSIALVLPFLIVNAMVTQATHSILLLAMVLFFGTAFGFGMVYGEVRQALAVSYGLSGLVLLLDSELLRGKKRYKVVRFIGNTLFVAGLLFHISGALFPLLFYVMNKKWENNDWRKMSFAGLLFLVLGAWFFWGNTYLKQLVFHFVRDGMSFPGPGQVHILVISIFYYISFYSISMYRYFLNRIILVLMCLSLLPIFGYTAARLSFVLLLFIVVYNFHNIMQFRSSQKIRLQGFLFFCVSWTLFSFSVNYYKNGLHAFADLKF
jgi:hypothetical protein